MNVRHVMILASAGSGKTFALTNRYLSLLAQGAAPERIVALTFTRKAAGEFFDGILEKLAAAAESETAAAVLAGEIGMAEAGTAPFGRLLRRMIDAMPQLRLGTLDGFFARVVRSFPLELGLTGDFELLEEHGAKLERRRVLQRMFLRAAGALDQAQKDFIEAFKRANFGREEKRLAARLDAYLDAHHEIFLEASAAGVWGDPTRIWPEGNPWSESDATGPLRVLRDWAAAAEMTDDQRARWEAFADAVTVWRPGAVLVRAMEYLLEKALEVLEDLRRGSAELVIGRKTQTVGGEAAAALAEIAVGVLAAEFARRLAVTRGIHSVLRGYESFYHDAVRRGGKLTFADVQRLLETTRLSSGWNGAEDEFNRWSIDFRLDGQVDHWLFDEFQDTSYGQWSILRNLVDEVVQDPTGQRSFFSVGDIKQAIYGWRGGDSRLFREVFQHYNRAVPGSIAEEHLDRSWRSGPAVIDLVNTVFGAAPELAGLFPGAASTRWNQEWRDHASALPDRTGQAALLFGAEEQDRWQLTVDLVSELKPLEHGLTCAVLVQSNDQAIQLADHLRRATGLPAIAESDEKICVDHPSGAALAALVQAAAHPGDRLAWEHVRMSPLARILDQEGIATPDDLASRLLGELHAQGFARTFAAWLHRMEALLAPDDRFSRERARQFAAAARAFDATGSRDPSEFLEFVERYALRSPESSRVIRVMTVHKSKGLGFDLVVLPDLEGKTLNERRDGLAVHKTPDRAVDWVLDLPPKLFWGADPVLAEQAREAEAEACYEKLCWLYVALTRAKRGLYVITKPVGKSASANFPQLLARTLGTEATQVRVGGKSFAGAWSTGNADWHLAVAAMPSVLGATRSTELEVLAGAQAVPRRVALRPSETTASTSLSRLFSLDSTRPLDFGARVHELLAEVEFADLAARNARIQRWRGGGEAENEAAEVLRNPALAGVWERPTPDAEVWRERAFEAVLENQWITGLFDRVVLTRDATGKFVRAVIYDFKTDWIGEGENPVATAARHAPQLGWYRRAVQALTGLNLEAIACEIVLTRIRQRIRL
jgi:ATP-dependent helicase/nuclease subunit A